MTKLKLLSTAWLTVLWMILWRSTSPATIVTGVAAATAASWAVSRRAPHRERHKVHLPAACRYLVHMAVALIKSNVTVAREIVTPGDGTSPGIVHVRLPRCSELTLTLVANSVTLTPGTLTLDADPVSSTITVHVLHLSDAVTARGEIEELHRLVTAAFEPVTVTEESRP